MTASILRADGTWTADTSRIVRAPAARPALAGDVVALETYLAFGAHERAGVGVWLTPDSEPHELAAHTATVPLIAIDFPAFKDGRGFSTATLLRTRYGFRGDLRAIGDVVIDLLFYLRRVGYSSFALRADQDRAAAVAALRSFSDFYQASVDQPLPHFRRRIAEGARL